MKKTAKTKLRLGREAVRALQTQELRAIAGGDLDPQRPHPLWTGDSHKVCCV